MLSMYFLIFLLLGSLYLLRRPLYINDLVIGVLCSFGTLLLGTLFLSKRVLFTEHGNPYVGLILKKQIFFKKKTDLDNIVGLSIYEDKDPIDIPWWFSVIGSIWTERNAYKFKLKSKSGKERYLISFKELEMKDKASDFFERNTSLNLENFEY